MKGCDSDVPDSDVGLSMGEIGEVCQGLGQCVEKWGCKL